MSRFLQGTRALKVLGSCARIYATKSAGEAAAPRSEPGARRFSSRTVLGILAGCVATCGATLYALDKSVVEAATLVGHPPAYPWGFKRVCASLDHAAVRRGWQVYKAVCASCHSIQWVAFRDFVDVIMSEEEAKALAAEYTVLDGPDEEGQFYERPGKLMDRIPGPYANEEEARTVNGGAYPPDLSYIVPGRHNGVNYVFSLLTGYTNDVPSGVQLMDGQHYNVYFEGGAISMAQPLRNGAMEYEDDTPATISQMAKDVVEFMAWTADQSFDTRVIVSSKMLLVLALAFALILPVYRKKMNHHRRGVIAYFKSNKKSWRSSSGNQSHS